MVDIGHKKSFRWRSFQIDFPFISLSRTHKHRHTLFGSTTQKHFNKITLGQMRSIEVLIMENFNWIYRNQIN